MILPNPERGSVKIKKQFGIMFRMMKNQKTALGFFVKSEIKLKSFIDIEVECVLSFAETII